MIRCRLVPVSEMTGHQQFMCRRVLLGDVMEERRRQHREWGEQALSGAEWLAVLMEEVGEAARAVLRQRVVGDGDVRQLREELVQVAAVAVQWVEALDRESAAVG